ncbi:hypothetical protein BABINDRAFT_24444, partial [Babjeviella inositovora NRRL Y-12698]
NNYTGYKPTEPVTTVESIALSAITNKQFFEQYVGLRKPVVINGVIPQFPLADFKADGDAFVEFLGAKDCDLQVEQKVRGGFGSGSQRVKMKLPELLEKFKDGDHDWYLTTQYLEDDPELLVPESDNDEEPSAFGNIEDFSDFSDDSIDMENIQDDFDEEGSDISDEDGSEGETDDPIVSQVFDKSSDEPLRLSEAKMRVQELVQQPLTGLAKSSKFPLQPELLSTLVPQQINLWMGSNTQAASEFTIDESDAQTFGLGRSIPGNGTSSGLHHDHADNLYIPIRGQKRFTIYAPSDAAKLSTVGRIFKIYANGLIDYNDGDETYEWKHVRDDGALVTEAARYELLTNEDLADSIREELETIVRQQEDEELAEALSGANSLRDRFDDNFVKKDPPSFSRIPPALLHMDEVLAIEPEVQTKLEAFADKNFPGFLQLNKMVVALEPGQMLYLPAGWFHEVTSFGGDANATFGHLHLAVNYWYLPPNTNDFEKPYADNYWKRDFERTSEAITLLNKGAFEL